jgi:prephenate dehydrogenase
MNTVAIVGVGLLGGSFAMDLRRCGFTGCILGVSRSPRDYPPAFSAGASFEQAASRADLILLCSPVQSIITDIARVDAFVRPGALISDVGSTKGEIMDAARKQIRRGVFLGGHPMAGKHAVGLANACERLFEGKTWFLVHSVEPAPPSVTGFVSWIEKIGARPLPVDAASHDRSVALTSHLPQLASTALGVALSALIDPETARDRSGQGLHDSLRLAESDWYLWRDILVSNRSEIRRALTAYRAALDEFDRLLGSDPDSLGDAFTKAQAFARLVRQKR